MQLQFRRKCQAVAAGLELGPVSGDRPRRTAAVVEAATIGSQENCRPLPAYPGGPPTFGWRVGRAARLDQYLRRGQPRGVKQAARSVFSRMPRFSGRSSSFGARLHGRPGRCIRRSSNVLTLPAMDPSGSPTRDRRRGWRCWRSSCPRDWHRGVGCGHRRRRMLQACLLDFDAGLLASRCSSANVTR